MLRCGQMVLGSALIGQYSHTYNFLSNEQQDPKARYLQALPKCLKMGLQAKMINPPLCVGCNLLGPLRTWKKQALCPLLLIASIACGYGFGGLLDPFTVSIRIHLTRMNADAGRF
jgi:hypothetical protein